MARLRSGTHGRILRSLVGMALVAALALSTGGVAIGATKVVKAADGNDFKPKHKYITKGDSIKWKNTDNTTHNVKATDQGKNWNYSKTLSPNETATRKFSNNGSYHYKCTLHPGMTGIIHVLNG
jgi:plastocyanin